MQPRLNRQLTLEKRVETLDEQGGFTLSWVPLGYLWASIDDGSPSLSDSGDFTRLKKRVRIILRTSPVGAESRPRPDQRFREKKNIYDILAVETMPRALGYLVCYCQSEEMT